MRLTHGRVVWLAAVLSVAASADAEVVHRIPGRGQVFEVAIDPTGRFVVGSERNGPCGFASQVFLYDRRTGRSECVSVASNGVVGNFDSESPSISADGQLIAFMSAADNLDPRCRQTLSIFLRNRRTGRTECVSVPRSRMPREMSQRPQISADGSTVVFESCDDDLADGDFHVCWDVFAAPIVNGTRAGPIELLSLGRDAAGASLVPNAESLGPAVSANGRFVCFTSYSSHLVPDDPDQRPDVFVRDRVLRATGRVSPRLAVEPDPPLGGATSCSISSDGRFVVFQDFTTIAGGIYRRDRLTGALLNITRNPDGGRSPVISADGRIVAFTARVPNPSRWEWGVFAVDLLTPGAPRRLDVTAAGQPSAAGDILDSAAGHMVVMSADARVLLFASSATDLSPGGAAIDSAFVTRLSSGAPHLIAGSGLGTAPRVDVFGRHGDPIPPGAFAPYGPGFGGGVGVAYGDLDGDGAADLVTGAGPSGGPHVRVFTAARYGARSSDDPAAPDAGSPIQHELAGFFAYHPAFSGGVAVAVGDVTGDGRPELITGAGPGGGPHVRVFELQMSRDDWGHADITEYASFFAFAPAFTGGVTVAVADVDGDGIGEVLAAAGPGGGPHVQAFKVDGGRVTSVLSFFAYDPRFTGGVFVAGGDVDGDGLDEIITGAGAGGGPHVRVFSSNPGLSTLVERSGFMAFPGFGGGVRVAAGDIDGDGRADIVAGAGPGGPPQVIAVGRADDGALSLLESFLAGPPASFAGVFVAAAPH